MPVPTPPDGTLTNSAVPSDLANRGYSGTASTAVQQTWLHVAFRALVRELRRQGVDLTAAVTNGEVDEEDVKDVVVAAALRALRNPEGAAETSGSIDDYRETVKRRDATEDIYFTAAELRRLTPAVVGQPWAGSVKYT